METASSLDTEQQFRRSLRSLDDALTLNCRNSPLGGVCRRSDRTNPAEDFTSYTAVLPGSRTLQTDPDLTVDLSLFPGDLATVDGRYSCVSESTTALGVGEVEDEADEAVCDREEDGVGVDDLCRHFFDSRRALAGAAQTLELLTSYQTLCQRRLDRLGRQMRSRYRPGGESRRGDSEQRLWQQLSLERDTWRLMAALFADEMTERESEEDSSAVDPASAVQRLFLGDSGVRRAQLVVDWLEQCASDQLMGSFHERVEFFSDAPSGWENTLHALRSAGGGGGSDSQLTPALDPDAPARLKRHLHSVDVQDEQRLLRYVFALLRAGRLTDAQQLCVRVGQAWRAAALDGWKLYSDGNLTAVARQRAAQAPAGNRQRELWRLAAWRLADSPHADRYERAVYGALCGHLDAVLAVCVDWEDRVWALFRQQVDVRVAQELDVWREASVVGNDDRRSEHCERELREVERRRRNPGQRGVAALFDEADSLEESSKTSTSTSAKRAGSEWDIRRLFNRLQRQAVLGDMEAMMSTLADSSSQLTDTFNHHTSTAVQRRQLLRAVAHMALLLRCQTDSPSEQVQTQCDCVLDGYIQQLITDAATEQAVWFISRLTHSELRTRLLSQLMSGVDERSCDAREREVSRKLVLEQAERAGLPVSAATLLLVSECRRSFVSSLQKETVAPSVGSPAPCTDTVAAAITWLLYEPTLRVEAVCHTNTVCRVLLLSHNVAAAGQLAAQLPDDTGAVINTHWRVAGADGHQLTRAASTAVRELLCVRALLLALQSYDDWSEQFHRRPKSPPQIAAGDAASFAESIAHEQRVREFEVAELRWRSAHEALTQTASQRLYNVLLFPDGGWMSDQDDDDEGNGEELSDAVAGEDRLRQMEALRRIYLPQCVFVLQTVLRATGRHCECLQLADVIASERHRIYRHFSGQDLRSFLRGLRDICLPLLDTKHDALGYRLD